MCATTHGWVYDWQTLIAGLLALLAGVVTVLGTLIAANRQVKATKDGADQQITAAREQTAVARHQTEVMRDMERRRIASEAYAFHTMLEAAMGAVIEDAQAAGQLFPGTPGPDNSRHFGQDNASNGRGLPSFVVPFFISAVH